jgi:hypothetical protein
VGTEPSVGGLQDYFLGTKEENGEIRYKQQGLLTLWPWKWAFK